MVQFLLYEILKIRRSKEREIHLVVAREWGKWDIDYLKVIVCCSHMLKKFRD